MSTDIEAALKEYDDRMAALGGCADGFCYLTGRAKGQHTNGGCRCWQDKYLAQRVMMAARRLRDAVEKAGHHDR